jgi:hypothetical protein
MEEAALDQGWARVGVNGGPTQWLTPDQMQQPETLPKLYKPSPSIPGPPPGQPGYESITRQSIMDSFKDYINNNADSQLRSRQAEFNYNQRTPTFEDGTDNPYWADLQRRPGEISVDFNRQGNYFQLKEVESEKAAQLRFMMDMFDKEQAQQTKMAEINKPVNVAREGSVYDPVTRKMIPNPVEGAPNEIELIQRAQRGDKEAQSMLDTLQERKLAATKERTGAAAERDKFGPLLKSLPKLKQDAQQAESRVKMYSELSDMLDKGAGGLVPGLKGILAPIAEAMGVDSSKMSEAQAFQLMARAGVGKMRLELVGSGQVSNFEQDLMQRLSGGSIKTSRAAAKQLFDYYAKESVRKVDSYNKTIEELGTDFPDVARVYGRVGGAQPPPGQPPPSLRPPPVKGEIINGHEFLGGNVNNPKSWKSVQRGGR